MKRILALLSISLTLALVLAQPITASSPSVFTATNTTTFATGYIGSVSSGDISRMTGSWVVPPVTCQSSLSEAQIVGVVLGLSGSNINLILNVNIQCNQGSSSPSYYALFSVCAPSCSGNALSLTFTSGQKLSYVLKINPVTEKVVATLIDVTTKKFASYSAVVTGTNILTGASWFVEGPEVPCYPLPSSCTQALTEFTHPITLTNCYVVSAGVRTPISKLTGLTEITLVDSNNNVMAYPSALSATGIGFRVTFVSST